MWDKTFHRMCAAIILAGSLLSAQTAFAFTSVLNTATVTLQVGDTDPDPLNNTSTASLDVAFNVILAATKDDLSLTYTPGSSTTYTMIVTNAGTTQAEDVDISDTLPTGATISSISCAATVALSGSSCGTTTAVAGDTAFTYAGGVLPALTGSVTLTVTVDFASDMAAGSITNTVSVTDNTSSATTTASDTNTRLVSADVAVAKAATGTTYTPGGTDTYTLTITNAGPSDVTGVTVSDVLPAGVTLSGAWSCTADALGSACGAASGGTAGDATVSATVDVVNGGTVTIDIPVVFAATEADYL